MTPSCWPWIILTILTCYLPVYAQNDNLRFQHFVPEDGLSNSSVKCIQQDHQGFIWIGTANGLNRFDGHHFIKYKHQKNNTFSLTDNSINALYEDQQERLWVGTDIGLHLYDRVLDQFTRIPGPRINDKPVSRIISAILEDQDGNFWLGTDGGGFYGFNSKTMEFTPYRKEGQHHGQNSVHCLYQDSQDRLWVGTFGGLFQFDIYSREFVHYPNHELLGSDMNEDYVWDITEASDGSLWIGTIGNGLYLFQPQDNSFTHIQKLIPDAGLANAKNIQSLGIDDRSRIWIGTGTKGVLVFDHPSQEIIKCVNIPFDNSSISSNEIQVIYKDSAEDIWIGTRSQGISHWSRRNTAFRHIKHSAFQPRGLTSNMVTSFFQRGSGEIWIGTFGGGLNLYDPSNNHYKHYRNELNNTNSLGSDFILSVLEDSKGHVWTLHSKWGVTRFDPRVSSTAFRQYRIRYVLSIFEDSKDRIWLGAGFGLNQYDAHSDTFILCQKDTTIASSQIMTSVVAIYEDINKKMWFGSYEGLFSYNEDSNRFNQFHLKRDPYSNEAETPVTVITGDDLGHLWVGSTFGLARINTGSGEISIWDSDHGLPDDLICSIEIDASGLVWISTANGLSAFDPKEERFRNFDLTDGLQGMEFSARASLRSKTGNLYFGGENGFNVFEPNKILDNTLKPPVIITDLLIGNEEIPIRGSFADSLKYNPLSKQIILTEELNLRPSQNNLTFGFAALNYLHPAKNRYRYKLDGFQNKWSETSAQQPYASYTNLTPGNYTFRVMGSNNNQIWNDIDDHIRISISAPWYWTWWSKFLYVSTIFAFIFAYYRFQLRRKLIQAELYRLQELDAVKTKLFTNISHEFRTPLTIILGTVEQEIENKGIISPRSNLLNAEMIRQNSNRLLRLVDQMLEIRKLETKSMQIKLINGDVISFLRYLIESYRSVIDRKELYLKMQTSVVELEMDYDPEKLTTIITNLLSNAIKFTPVGGSISVLVEEIKLMVGKDNNMVATDSAGNVRRQMKLSVKDNGIGINPQSLPHVFDRFYQAEGTQQTPSAGTGIGLAITRELISLLGGEISVTSKVGKGTEFTILLPINQQARELESASNITAKLTTRLATDKKLENNNSQKETINAVKSISAYPLVLIIEDNKDVLSYLKTCLHHSYQVVTATNGQEGIRKAMEYIPNIIISDILMPVKDGLEVCKTLKRDEKTSHIPIILLTAKADINSRLEGLEEGADAYLIKPFNKSELLLRIKKLLQLREQLRHYYLSIVTRNNQLEPAEIGKIESVFISKVRSVIDANLNNPSFSISQLCREIAVSHSQLNRKLIATTGYTANGLIRFVRVSKAKELLISSSMNISEIAYEAGFRDPAYFTRVFKRDSDLTPSEFRKKNQMRHSLLPNKKHKKATRS